jgi:endonuclease/exonuclease/phosphatase family metal-dependent hydrolase
VYGEPRVTERHHMWTTLCRIKPNASDPWLMIGDFNETMWQNENLSFRKRLERQMADFRSMLFFL